MPTNLITTSHSLIPMKFRLLSIPLSFVLLVGVFSAVSQNQAYSTTSTSCTASLDGDQEVPPVVTDGTGSATIDFDNSTSELSWSIEFSGLSGPATAAHFHGPAAAGVNADVRVNIGDVSGLESPMEGAEELTSEQAEWLLDGELYINIHTATNPGGEIRGQVSCESAPAPDGEPPVSDTATVTIGDEDFDVEYAINGGTLEELSADPDVLTLAVTISTTSDGNLTLWLPTELIDAEDEFAVFVDGEFGNFMSDELEPTGETRVLEISFVNGTELIEIVGTSMAGGEEPEPELETATVEIEGQTYEIEYEMTGGTLESITADVNATLLIVSILSNASGTLTVWLPTEVIDAENDFTVLVDGGTANSTELEPTADSRVLQIGFEEGAQEISIAGTFIVPEFGAIAAIAAAAGILSGLVALSRFRMIGRK